MRIASFLEGRGSLASELLTLSFPSHTVEISVETGSPVKCEISKDLQGFQPFSKTNYVSVLFTVAYKIAWGFIHPF